MKTTFNIGLNNNPFNRIQVRTIVDDILLQHAAIKFDYRYVMSEFMGNEEPTFVCTFESTISQERMEQLVQALTLLMTQESIAVMTNNVGTLVFNPSHTGDRYQFDNQYFINM
jgi:hypothetical protein